MMRRGEGRDMNNNQPKIFHSSTNFSIQLQPYKKQNNKRGLGPNPYMCLDHFTFHLFLGLMFYWACTWVWPSPRL